MLDACMDLFRSCLGVVRQHKYSKVEKKAMMMDSISAEQLEMLEAFATNGNSVIVGTNWLVDFTNKESELFRDLIRKGLMQSVSAEDGQTQCLVLSQMAQLQFNKANYVSQRVQ